MHALWRPVRPGAPGRRADIEGFAAGLLVPGSLCEAGLVPGYDSAGLSHRAGRGRVCAGGQPGYRLAFMAAGWWHWQCPGRMDLGGIPSGWETPVNLSSHLVQRMLKLGAPLTRDLVVNRDLRVPMTDGAELLADRWAPRSGGEGLPVALLRCPYGRRGIMGMVHARPLAERGYQVLIQSTRGTFGSGGVFDPMRCEREDGAATLQWLVEQPWFGHSIVLAGESYLGYAQWAVAGRLPAEARPWSRR